MVLYLTQKDFDDLEAKANQEIAKPHSKLVTFTKTHDNQGMITTHDAIIQYYYNPGNGQLQIQVVKLVSLAAKIAPHQIVEAHILQAIQELEPLATEVEEVKEEVPKPPFVVKPTILQS